MRRKTVAWALFILCLLLLSLGSTRYSGTANFVLVSIRIALLAVLSILLVRERWRNRNDTILQGWRRWYHDEKKPSS
jgi:hypothetical protein